MASGPKITIPSAGDALDITDIAANFTAIQDFLSAIPIDNLEKYYASAVFSGIASRNTEPFGGGDTVYGPYFLPSFSGTDSTRLKEIQAQCELSATLAAGDSIVVTLEERTGTGPSVWAAIAGASLTIDNTTTLEGSENARVLLAWNLDSANAGTDLNPARLHRFKWTITIAGAQTVQTLQASAWCRCKLQVG